MPHKADTTGNILKSLNILNTNLDTYIYKCIYIYMNDAEMSAATLKFFFCATKSKVIKCVFFVPVAQW